jgi:hypothetical protein
MHRVSASVNSSEIHAIINLNFLLPYKNHKILWSVLTKNTSPNWLPKANMLYKYPYSSTI